MGLIAAILGRLAPFIEEFAVNLFVALITNLPKEVDAVREANTTTVVDVPALPTEVTDALNQEVQDAINQGLVPAPDAPLGH